MEEERKKKKRKEGSSRLGVYFLNRQTIMQTIERSSTLLRLARTSVKYPFSGNPSHNKEQMFSFFTKKEHPLYRRLLDSFGLRADAGGRQREAKSGARKSAFVLCSNKSK